jgi:PQQ-like domain
MEALPPRTRVGFAGVSGSAAELRQSLSRELPATDQPGGTAPDNQGRRESGAEIAMLPGLDNLAGGRLFVDDRQIVRTGPDGAQVLWKSAPVAEKRGEFSSARAAALSDSLIVFLGTRVFALDPGTGKMLWADNGVRLGSPSDATPVEWNGPLVWNGPAPAMLQMIARRRAAAGPRTLFFAGEQLLRLDAGGGITCLSSRNGAEGWSAHLPGPPAMWGTASVRTSGRYVALAASTAGHMAELVFQTAFGPGSDAASGQGEGGGAMCVAVVDAGRGRVLGVWNVPKDWPDFSIRPDGRAISSNNGQSKKSGSQ